MLKILSLGAGVQSSAMLLMSETGAMPKPDCAIFADTQGEPDAVYRWFKFIKDCIKSFPVLSRTKGSLSEDSLEIRRSKKSGKLYQRNMIPAFVDNGPGKKHGLLGRKCTSEYKVRVIVAEARRQITNKVISAWRKQHPLAWKEYATAKKEKRTCGDWAWDEMQADALCEMWIGISTDEAHRMKPSREPWVRATWPLIDKGISRAQCTAWVKKHFDAEPPRSACVYCPFHSDAEWVRLKTEEPHEFNRAVKFERQLQSSAKKSETLRGVPYLHVSLKPLDEVVFSDVPAHSQVDLFGNECEGLCGV